MSSITLTELVTALRPDVVQHVAGSPQTAVHSVELFDIDEQVSAPPCALLLAVGLDVRSPARVDRALAMAAESAGVLTVRADTGGHAAFLRSAAVASGAAVLTVDPAMPWTRLFGLVSTLVATGVDAERAAEGVTAGGDLFALANSVAAMIGGAVAIFDTDRTIVAYSSHPEQPIDELRRLGILARQVPDDQVPDHLAEGLWHSDTVQVVRRPGHLPRAAIVIRAGDLVLGSLWALFADEEAIAGTESVLVPAARSAALHMLTARRQSDADQEGRNGVLRAALDRTGGATHPLPCPGTLVCLAESGRDVGPHEVRANLLGVLDALGPVARALGHEPSMALVGDAVFMHLPHLARAVRLSSLLDHLTTRATRVSAAPLVVVVGDTVRRPDDLPEYRDDLEAAVRRLRESGAAPGRYSLADLRVDLVRQRLVDTVRTEPRLRSGLGARIARHDRENGSDHARTLLSFLRHFGDVRAVAEELVVHQNTVRQRIRTATRTFDLDLGSSAQRLVLELELKAEENEDG
ncbi:PucR family transcriptional regulator [Haloactinomyces albus]|uniref:PucR C-terminal helix-turn-helix domain-containing protein n=1 Tax=Haloactinomyces albus TaxID=1352928 RepID=A0AAE3ZGP1_9ACTN|nr:helix-turn-helix domain-containing protein [Haloactinomyces albus]MDR7303571.1 hypothetical protein [Haloactinomyces albus]